MENEIIFTVINILISAVTVFAVYRRLPYQNSSDAATAIQKFQETTVSIQAQMTRAEEKAEAAEKRVEELENVLEKAHLFVTLGIQIGKKPEVLDYKWTALNENVSG